MSVVLTLEEVVALARPTLCLVACWVVEDKLGNVSRHTALDTDIYVNKSGLEGLYVATKPVDGTTFAANDSLAVDNMEVRVPLDAAGITLASIRARLFDGMRYTVFLTDWKAPNNVGIIKQRGVVGNVRLVTENTAAFELRGLKQSLQQNIVELVSRTCRTQLGSSRCKVNLSQYTVTGTVVSVSSQRRTFVASGIDAGGSASEAELGGWYDRGVVMWTTGLNADLHSEVKTHSGGGSLELLLPMPFNIVPGDTFTVYAGCDRLHTTCRDKFNNLLNFQGEPDAEDLLKLLAKGLS